MREPSVDRRHEPAVERPGSTRAELPALAAVLGLLGTCDALLLAAAAYGRMGPVYGLVLHAALMGVAAASAQHRIVGDRTPWVIGLVATAIAGPLGALGGLLVLVMERSAAQSQTLLDDWYAWMSGSAGEDRAAAAYEAIVTGRSVRPGAQSARRFSDVILTGALPEKQAVLGLIGLKYHRDYLPVLQLALRSPQASVRAQAAAVFVKLKERWRGELAACLSNRRMKGRMKGRGAASDRSLMDALNDARTVLDCCRSGFIDAAEAREALGRAAGWCGGLSGNQPLAQEAEELTCELLAAAGDHEQLVTRFSGGVGLASGGARALLARSLMMLGRTSDLHKLLATGVMVNRAGESGEPA